MAGDASITTATTLELRSNGTFSRSFIGITGGRVVREKTAGSFQIVGDLIVFTEKDGRVTKVSIYGSVQVAGRENPHGSGKPQ